MDDRRAPATRMHDVGRPLGLSLRTVVRQADVGTETRQLRRDRSADPSGASDQRDLAGEVHEGS